MSTPLTDAIENLTNYINEVTGGSDDNLSDAIATLADGYGSGGISIDDWADLYKPVGDLEIHADHCPNSYLENRSGVTSVSAQNCIAVGNNAFSNMTNLKTASLPEVIEAGNNVFYADNKLESAYLPKLKIVKQCLFYNCYKLEMVNLSSVETINNIGIVNCTSLKTLKLPKCTRITNTTSLNGCTALTDIYLPNAESSYSNAPWGATNATIHYNTQFDENGEPILE